MSTAKNSTSVIAAIKKLLFGDEAAAPVEVEVAPVVPVVPVVEEPAAEVELNPDGSLKVAEAAEVPEVVAPVVEVALADVSIEDQVAALRKQMEVINEFSYLKESVDRMNEWMKNQLVVNASYKQAFRELIGLVETVVETPTDGAITIPKTGIVKAKAVEAGEKLDNFMTSLKAAKAEELAAKNKGKI